MKEFLFILGTERYSEEQIKKACEIAQDGGYTEVFVPTPDGNSRVSGKITYTLTASTFRCGTMIVPLSIFAKIIEDYRFDKKSVRLTFCDLIDTWRCELNRVAALDAGIESNIIKRGKVVRRINPSYEYPV